jgi:ATP phosphoribosyltransferase regulatory subunit
MYKSMRTWALPEYIEDILPAEAEEIEQSRRRILDLFLSHGYRYVIPPLVEYLDSLLTGTASDLDPITFKLVDQLSGRLLGLRADITPQVARIDAHLLNRQGLTRLCYVGSVVHTVPSGISKLRQLLQIGAELYGSGGLEADIEVERLMLEALKISGIGEVRLDLGHVSVFRSLVRQARASGELEAELFRAMQAKDGPRLRELSEPLDDESRCALRALPELYGGVEVLKRARRELPLNEDIAGALDELQALTERLSEEVELCLDLSELRGYQYHSGVVFAAYTAGHANSIGQGGRYDEVGKAFGRARPATGFSMDLRALARFAAPLPRSGSILAPACDDPKLKQKIESLRASGERVVCEFPNFEASRDELDCDRELKLQDGEWRIVTLDPRSY